MDATVAPQQRLQTLRLVGDFAGPTALAAFGLTLWVLGQSENMFSFLAWGTLDIIMGLSMYKSGSKKEAVLPICYGIIAFVVVAIIYHNGKWSWGLVENISAGGVVISLLGWYFSGPLFAVVMSGITLVIASIPILISTYYAPVVWEWWLWVAALVSAAIGLHLTRPWKLDNISRWLFTGVSFVVSCLMLYLILR